MMVLVSNNRKAMSDQTGMIVTAFRSAIPRSDTARIAHYVNVSYWRF
ncbi:hypothetical protein [Neorhizobium sp. LjRoot104]